MASHVAADRGRIIRDAVVAITGIVAALLVYGQGLVALPMAALLIAAVLAAVHHAETIGLYLGEPFGTLVLALAVTVIEGGLIIALMLSGEPNPFLLRDTIHAVVVLVLHGVAGACILVGTIRHREQVFSTRGASAFLAVLLPLTAMTLVLPNQLITAQGPYYSPVQLAFVSVACLGLYASFVVVQTVQHPNLFRPPDNDDVVPHAAARPTSAEAGLALGLLVLALVAVVLLGKALGPAIKGMVAAVGAPMRLEGVIIAAIVLMPESITAIRAAARNRLQTSINLALGSAVASIGLTVPAIAAVAWWIGQPLALGVDQGAMVLLTLSFLVAIITYGTGLTTALSGLVHLVLLALWLFVIFQP